ncbi:hypothetical protein HMPREF9446_02309 [Bacteroides fluxus YIT 12057]|uniref:Uncharacterized protein n=1 Tax=Bacteroides fluxus YIT 12057 TaxID=763034 RepID=F3PU86_9BACE|nr:hypothetical protein HMPREF9446_02309 [Bacteroides fluxus YIT 12057]
MLIQSCCKSSGNIGYTLLSELFSYQHFINNTQPLVVISVFFPTFAPFICPDE